MRRTVLVSVSAMVIVASGIVGCTDIGIGIASGAVHVGKSAFCGANESIDRASANVTSEAGLLGGSRDACPRLDGPGEECAARSARAVGEARRSAAPKRLSPLTTPTTSTTSPMARTSTPTVGSTATGRHCRRTSARGRRPPSARPSFRSSTLSRMPPPMPVGRPPSRPIRRRSTNSLRNSRRCPKRSGQSLSGSDQGASGHQVEQPGFGTSGKEVARRATSPSTAGRTNRWDARDGVRIPTARTGRRLGGERQ